MSYLTEFDGKAFQSVAKADESLDKLADEVDESTKEAEKALEPFVERVKNLLGDRVKEGASDPSSDRHPGDCHYRCR